MTHPAGFGREHDEERRQSEEVLPQDRDASPEREIYEHDRADRKVEYLEPEDNEAHASGKVCERCGAVITASEDVRLLPDGHWIHEVCPLDLGGLSAEGTRPADGG
jgi:hypothetical protein